MMLSLQFRKVREQVKKRVIEVQHISTAMMLADPLTKALPIGEFKNMFL